MKTKLASIFLLCLVFAVSASTAQSTNMTLTMLDHPCRILDTRLKRGPLAINEIRIFSVEEGFSALQGGTTAPGCHVPLTARAVKMIVQGQPLDTSGGYFRVFNANASVVGPFSSIPLQDQGTFTGHEIDVPVDGNLLVAIHTIVRAHAVADLSGYYTPMN